MAAIRPGRHGHRRARILAPALLGGLLLAPLTACGESEPGAAPSTMSEAAAPEMLPAPAGELEVVATDYAFTLTPDASTPIAPGWTEIHLRNDGAEAHQVMFARIKEGVDMAELAAAGAGDSSGAGAIEFVDMLGGVSYIGPGNEITALVDLPEGVVLAMCYVPDANGVAHALMGMTATLTVAGEPTAEADSDEEVAGTIELADDGYRFPDQMPAGWYHVVNSDDDDPATGLHELALLALDRDLDAGQAEEVVARLAANEDPGVGLDAVGGMGALTAGFDGYLYLDLADTQHLAVDFMPDPGDPRPHMLDGYHATFTP